MPLYSVDLDVEFSAPLDEDDEEADRLRAAFYDAATTKHGEPNESLLGACTAFDENFARVLAVVEASSDDEATSKARQAAQEALTACGYTPAHARVLSSVEVVAGTEEYDRLTDRMGFVRLAPDNQDPS